MGMRDEGTAFHRFGHDGSFLILVGNDRFWKEVQLIAEEETNIIALTSVPKTRVLASPHLNSRSQRHPISQRYSRL